MAPETQKRDETNSADGHTAGFDCLSCVRGPQKPSKNGANGVATVVSESSHGGEDLWDGAAAEHRRAESGSRNKFPEHLVIMVNGIIGRLILLSVSAIRNIEDSSTGKHGQDEAVKLSGMNVPYLMHGVLTPKVTKR